MESRANYALVGLFTLAVLAAAFGFVYWFNAGGSGRKENVRVIFTGSVTGLGRGSSVLFNGLRVGEVSTIELQPDDPRRIYAVISVNATTPVRVDTRARIEAQGLAGVVALQLIGGDPEAPPLKAKPGEPMATIIAERSELQDILETVRNVAQKADGMLGSLDGLIKQNAGPINNTVRNVEKFSEALGKNSDGLDKLMASFGNVAETIQPLSQKLQTLSEELTEVVKSVDRRKITDIVDNVDKFTAALGNSSADTQRAVNNVASITDKINRAADQVEGVLKSVQSFLNTASGPDGRSALNEISDAAKSIRVLADNLDKRTAEISVGINRFTGVGLRNVDSTVSDAKRVLTEINRTLRSLERNPQQLIFGGKPPLPQYNGAR
ncbi:MULTISPECIES: MlaD family protein [unclassified Bosea (in: a-proteobacteria)]|uniref:MlaD family protein n=1 Tax=unclassified Bosea (in: a-proteobacteria) TaxID=2653178 RepID=UPI0009552561|nr:MULTISPECIES: MlaD family protein [unclassified Bosea (in: a-proteobacteria)]TAJ31873.1 MAG: MCE family protein [Bosea sp. (in: a-proteobacteria)]SIQ02937.1 phospholipid/cholesterol/gamma-HCH transport system substrate-binding protein [Bosea sp. TND4EK4]